MVDTQSPWVDDQTWKTRWEKIEELKGGGQGEAYRARRLSDGRVGFLKIIKSKKDAERRARFFREATAYDSFGVNGVPKLIESNAHRHSDDSVTPFIVTEFIEGVTLRSWRISQTAVSIETAVTITSRLLDILAACHAQGCVHRDVKPDNIILAGGAVSCVWLLDFGISYHNLAEIDFQTEDGQEVGNRFLRLPELSAGSVSKQDPRSDICFAAGIFFYLLTGDHPDLLEDSEGRLPHQRPSALAKLQQSAAGRLARLLTLFDDAFTPRTANRFSSVKEMHERMEKMMQDQSPIGASADEDLAALREVLVTSANHRLSETITKFSTALHNVRHVFDQVQRSLGASLSISQTGWNVSGERGQNTLYWSFLGSTDRILSVTYEVVPAGEELLLRLSGETVYRTELAEPVYEDRFRNAIQTWLAAKLRTAITDPTALASEADLFRDTKPFGSLETAAEEAAQRNRAILAFVYDPTKPERGKLRWALNYFLENRRTHDVMNGAFVTALVPLSAFAAISDILDQQSMERPRWVVLDQRLCPLEQHVIQANPQEGERIMGELANRYGAGSGPSS